MNATTKTATAATDKFVVVVHLADGTLIRGHATKRAAKADGTAVRRAGGCAFVYSAADYAKVSK